MTSITQQIPSYIAGISQQPDELKVPGQLRRAKNVLPDVTHGLMKRPGGRLIGGNMSAYTTASKWFHYYRDEIEQYIGQIQLSSGAIKMWRCDTGAAVTVSFAPLAWATSTAYIVDQEVSANNKIYKATTAGTSTGSTAPSHSSSTATVGGNTWEYVNTTSARETALKAYLATAPASSSITDSDLQTLTLNDFTYIVNRNCEVAMDATTETARPPEAYIDLKKIAYANQYAVNIFDNTALTSVATVTRIKVDRKLDSSNSCDTSGESFSKTNAGTSGYTSACDDSANTYNGLDMNDSLCPNTATQIFSGIGSSVAYTDRDEAHTAVVKDSGNNTVSGRTNLYFRIATIGQSVPSGSGNNVVYNSRYTTTHDLLYGGSGWAVGDYVEVWMANAKYRITVLEISTAKVQANLGLIRPTPTPFDVETTITAESIIGSIRGAIVATGNFADADVQQIGTGLYITRASNSFNISTPGGELLNVFTDSIDDIAELPQQCKHGYVVKIKNSQAEEDDYYVKFIGDNDRDGTGVWEECPQPGVKTHFNSAKMPIQLVRQATGTFVVSPITWDPRQVGDTVTTPEPSFIGKTINKMLFFRNRLVMLSDENVIMSRPGDFFNFWPKSAITFTATDNIDLSCSSEYPAVVYDGIQVNTGLILFTKNQQFMLTTDSDVLSPLTAKINAISSYNFNFYTNPISLGTTITFLDNAGKYSRVWEMTAVLREGEPNVLEQSKSISKAFPQGINMIANSRENSTIFFGEKDTTKLYGFRYHSVAERRIQQAWFEWELSGNVQHIAMLDDALYAVIKNSNDFVIQKFSLKLDDSSHTITDDKDTTITDDDITYRIHLDSAATVAYTDLTYDASNNWTKFTFPAGLYGTGQLAVFAVSTGTDKEYQGSLVNVTTFNDNGTTKVKIPGDWKTTDSNKAFTLILGYLFDMEIEFPTIYVTQVESERSKADLHGSLVVHRTKFSFGHVGVYDTTAKRTGKPDYTETFESKLADAYNANRVGIDNEQIFTLPLYEKNTNLKLTLKSTHPSPATLYSMSWEGDYTGKYYKRV